MKKRTLSLSVAAVFLSAVMYSQVGINTPNPASTLDVTAKNATGTTTNVDGLLVPRVDRQRAQSMASVPTSTLIYVNGITTGTQTGTAVNIDAVGYYYYNGTVWTKLNPVAAAGSGVNIYNADGTLTGNRTVTQGANTLKFTGSSVDAFSVDGNAFSVDAANNRVGIGTTAPEHKFHIVAETSNSNRFNLIDAPSPLGVRNVLLALRNTSPVAVGNYSLLGFTNNGPASGGANWGIGSIRTGTTNNLGADEAFFIGNSLGANYNERLRINSDGNVGIATSTPQRLLHVNGAMQLTNELNVGGTAAAAGSAGTSGQILTSKGPGAAPGWSNVDAVIPAAVNIYNADGTLTGNRTVTQGANTLKFTGTGTNAFSVDGSTFSVDAANDRVGIGTSVPTNKLHITSSADPLKLEGITDGVTGTDKLLVLDTGGVVKSIGTLGALSIPTPAIFRLATTQNNFLNGVSNGSDQRVPMAMIKNAIPDLTYNASTSTITFPAGTYQMMFVYEGAHNNTGCNISSYFVDFPLDTSTQRVHSTAAHSEGGSSNHGGNITYVTTIPANKTWQIQLGRGQSGNCNGSGMTLFARSTQLLVYRIGD